MNYVMVSSTCLYLDLKKKIVYRAVYVCWFFILALWPVYATVWLHTSEVYMVATYVYTYTSEE